MASKTTVHFQKSNTSHTAGIKNIADRAVKI